jgi:hypothetical protein
MVNRKRLARPGLAFLSLLLVLVAIPGLTIEREGTAAAGEWRNVVVVYASDCKGKIEPCG